MFTGDLRYWTFLIGGVLFVGLCVWAMLWALFSDRARGRRRCPRCWYDMSGSPGLTCSECGHAVTAERTLFKTRRRPALAIVAALAAALASAVNLHTIRQDGWASIMPTSVLIIALPLADDLNGDLGSEVIRRRARSEVSIDQWRSIANRCLSGDPWARPVSQPWVNKYADLLNLVPPAVLAEPLVVQGLLDLPPRLDLRMRRTWPVDMAPWAELRLRSWWPAQFDTKVEITPQHAGAATIVAYQNSRVSRRDGLPFEILHLDPDATEVTVDIRAFRRAPGGSGMWDSVTERSVTLPIARAGSVTSIMTADTEITAEIIARRVFTGGITKWADGPSPVRFSFRRDQTTNDALFDGLAIGASLELLYEGQLARQLNLWWRAGRDASEIGYGFDIAYENTPLLRTFDPLTPGWTYRVIGRPELAARAPAAQRYWSGSIDLPLDPASVTLRPDTVQRHPWWREDGSGVDEFGDPIPDSG